MEGTIFIILGTLFLLASLWLCIRPILPSALFAYMGMWLFQWSETRNLSSNALIFWGAATALLLGINYLQGRNDAKYYLGNVYLLAGTVVGLFIGLALGEAYMIGGAWIGSILGEFAYAKTPKGKYLLLSLSEFISYFCKKGIQTLITVSMVGTIIQLYTH